MATNSQGNIPTGESSGFDYWLNSSPPPPPSPAAASFPVENLSAAEKTAERILNCVHPTLDSEERRRDVVRHIQHLIQSRVTSCQVISFGSVPLKTYLPDGDIDLSVIKTPKSDESVVHEVLTILQDEEQNKNAEYEVKDTRFIDAEVKLVKCLVHDIMIDISFSQFGGLSALCFLEQVDALVGRIHLFKRSILLIKAWCYYESRILGAHHGLLSTYALEILILYIIQHFNSSLNSPLSVLYQFLDYYSQFDWENYGISLNGPVYKSYLPNIVVKTPIFGWSALFKDDLLKSYTELYSVPSTVVRTFQTKHFNIIDPLKENNNLGRSVHRGNYSRIRSALRYGAQKFRQILSRPRDEISGEIVKFFKNTIPRNRSEFNLTFQNLALDIDDEISCTASLSSTGERLSYHALCSDVRTPLSENRLHALHVSDQIVPTYSLDNLHTGSMSFVDELEALDPLADLAGDYASHIRSFLAGRVCHFSMLSACYSSLSSRNQDKNSGGVICESVPVPQKFSSQVNSHPEWRPKGLGVGGSSTHRPSKRRNNWNAMQHNNSHHYKYGSADILGYPALEETKPSWNGSQETQPPRIRRAEPRTLRGPQKQDLTSWRIQFGSVRIPRRAILSPAHGGQLSQYPRASITQQRAAGPLAHLENEDEFPPLCL